MNLKKNIPIQPIYEYGFIGQKVVLDGFDHSSVPRHLISAYSPHHIFTITGIRRDCYILKGGEYGSIAANFDPFGKYLYDADEWKNRDESQKEKQST